MSLASRSMSNSFMKEETYRIYVEKAYRIVPVKYDKEDSKKISLFDRIFKRKKKIIVFRLVFEKNGLPSYEEYTTHRELYERLVSEKIVRNIYFPETISINEFIDLGFSLRYTFNR